MYNGTFLVQSMCIYGVSESREFFLTKSINVQFFVTAIFNEPLLRMAPRAPLLAPSPLDSSWASACVRLCTG